MHRSARIANRVFEFALRLYPVDFRERYAECMACVFSESCEAADERSGVLGVLSLLARALADVALTSSAERITDFAPRVGFTSPVSVGAAFAIHAVLLSFLLWLGIHSPQIVPTSCERKIQSNSTIATGSASATTDRRMRQ